MRAERGGVRGGDRHRLLFFGVIEPVYDNFSEGGGARPLWIDIAEPGNGSIGIAGMIHHWGLDGWAGCAAIGLSPAIFAHNPELPLTLRSAYSRFWGTGPGILGPSDRHACGLRPFFGLTTSLGLGAQQVAAGLEGVFGIAPIPTATVLSIIVITSIAPGSVLLGMVADLKRLSTINRTMAVALFIFVIAVPCVATAIMRYCNVMVDDITLLPALSNPLGREDTSDFHG